ncbi:hypothetical protein TNCV_4690261 [Trichonephila clavipes]|nr:hypothetical protein TNCV_4690261 [Trichonephila clavipes]
MREKGVNRLVPGSEYMVDALKPPNQVPRVSGESLQTCVAWRCPDGTLHLFCWPQFWPFQSHQTHSRTFLDVSPGLATVSAASPLFHHDRFRTILSYAIHFSSPVTIHIRNVLSLLCLARPSQMEIRSITFFCGIWCGTQTSSFFLNPVLLKWLKTVLWSIFSSWAILRLLTCR